MKGFSSMIKERIEKFYTEKKRDWDKVAFYVTDAGKCPRAVWFGFKKFPKKDKDPRVMRVFENGDYTHMRIMSSLLSRGAVKAIELALENELVRGRCDGIVIEQRALCARIEEHKLLRFQEAGRAKEGACQAAHALSPLLQDKQGDIPL